MTEEQNIEQSPEDGKFERPEEVNDAGYQLPETSNRQPETAIPKSEIEKMEVPYHPNIKKKNFKQYFTSL